MLFEIFENTFNYAARWRHFCLRIRSQFVFLNSNGIACAHDFDYLGEGSKKNPQQPVSMAIVDVHVYKICVQCITKML